MRKSFAVVFAFVALLVSALALADRILPPNGQLGTLNAYQIGSVRIDDENRVPAAAIRVYGTNNLLLSPQQVPTDVDIWYTTEANGNVWKIWVLTEAEYKQQKAWLKQQKKLQQ